MFCRYCGDPIDERAEICPKCGVRQFVFRNQKSRIVAILLAILLGGIGAHKFYLGQAIGIIYLLFFWTFIPAIIAFFEGILYAITTKTDEEFTAKYGN